MSFDEDALLVRAVGDVGGLAGARRGAEMGVRRLKKNVLEIDLALDMPPQAAADRARQVLSQQGKLLNINGDDGTATLVVGIVGAGVGNLNPGAVGPLKASPSTRRRTARGWLSAALRKRASSSSGPARRPRSE